MRALAPPFGPGPAARWPSLAVLVLALAGCAGGPAGHRTAAFPVLSPATLGAPRAALQLLHVAAGTQEFALQCVVQATPDALTVVGLGPLGERWFSLRHDGQHVDFKSAAQAPAALDGRRLLADLQLALWPLPALQQAVAGSAWQVSEPAAGTRRLRRDGRLVAEVHHAGTDPWRGRLWLSNFETGYTLTVESRPLE